MKRLKIKVLALVTALMMLLAVTGCINNGTDDPSGKTDASDIKTETPFSKRTSPIGKKTSYSVDGAKPVNAGSLPVTVSLDSFSTGARYLIFVCESDIEMIPDFSDTDPCEDSPQPDGGAPSETPGAGGRQGISHGKNNGETFGLGWKIYVFTKIYEGSEVYESELGSAVVFTEGAKISAKTGQYIIILRSHERGVGDKVNPFFILKPLKET